MSKTQQVTQEQYDERFYCKEGMLNSRNGTKWFPSATHILKWKTTPPELMEWIGNKGYEESRRIMHRKGDLGKYVHNALERMLKDGLGWPMADIEKDFPDAKEALFVKRALKGALNWAENMQKKYDDFEILEAEQSLFGADYAGTVDLLVKMGGETWLIDFKTSKSVFPTHKIQVIAYQKARGADRGAVLLLGNRTKQRYTFSPICQDVKKIISEEEWCWKQFQLIKDLFYLDHPMAKPTEEEFPEEFKFSL